MRKSINGILLTWLVAMIAVGPGLPLVWCFSGADHSAIEFKTPGVGHGPQGTSAHPSIFVEIASNTKHVNDCIDRQPIPPASLVTQADDVGASDVDPVPMPRIDLALNTIEPLTGGVDAGIPPPLDRVSAQVLIHRIVVLLI